MKEENKTGKKKKTQVIPDAPVWTIPPSRCIYSQEVSIRIRDDNKIDFNATTTEKICSIKRSCVEILYDESRVLYKCCKENCPKGD